MRISDKKDVTRISTYAFLIIFFSTFQARAQTIDNNLTYRNIDNDRYFRFNYENDFFTATDLYYTQGIYLELVNPSLKYFPLSKILVHPAADNIMYGLSLEHNAYTPSQLGSHDILYHDRPFAASLFLNTFLIAVDSNRKSRFSTTLSTGVLGPAAFGHEMQRGIHKALGDVTPQGWQNQVANDVVLNYQLYYEKNIFAYRNNFALNALGTARAGTLSDKAGVGLTAMAGTFNNPFQISNPGKRLRIYLYGHVEADAIGYDATMEGGVFTRKNDPYVIEPSQVTRFTFQYQYGIVFTYKRLFVEYYLAYITKEFNQGMSHRTGGINIGF